MSETLDRVRSCVLASEVRLSRHASRELDDDDIMVDDVLDSVAAAIVVEDYPDAGRGPSVLTLHRLRDGAPIHVVWGFYKDTVSPAVVVTAYRPDPRIWSSDFMRRLP